MSITKTVAQAYINFGRWVSDCPASCGNAYAVTPGQTQFHCALAHDGCGYLGELVWDPNSSAVWEALMERPMPRTRNWFPEGHPLAIQAGCPMGQSVEELHQEARENGAS